MAQNYDVSAEVVSPANMALVDLLLEDEDDEDVSVDDSDVISFCYKVLFTTARNTYWGVCRGYWTGVPPR